MFDPRFPNFGGGGCGCSQVVEVLVPGIQGPPGSKTSVLFTEQTLTEEEKAQARANIGAASMLQASEIQGFSVRHTTATLMSESAGNDLALLTPQGDFRTGDTVIDAKNYLFQITALDADTKTFSVTRRLARLGVTDYRELDSLPHLGKLAGLDSVGEEQLNDIINLGSIQ